MDIYFLFGYLVAALNTETIFCLHVAYFVSGFDLFDQFRVFLQLFTQNLKLFTARAVGGCAVAANKVSLSDESCFLSNAALFAASH